MNTVEIIRKKREGDELTSEEIQFLIRGYAKGEIPDYQMSAWTMAVYFQGMTPRETADLTMEMVRSGDQVDLSPIRGVKVDKHSTGGVGDTTTLVLAPLVAAAGVPVAKLSGRGLGHTGGTIDKLESFPGFDTSLTTEAFIRQVNDLGVAVMGQTADLTPADKQLYALRDVTASVESIPLIASSIMSKKIAAGADGIVLDVKTGSGAFMKEEEQAVQLAQAMVEIGTRVGRRTMAVISDMNQPLGRAVGNALEVKEAIDTLRGQGPPDLTELCLVLGAQMVTLAGGATDEEGARELLREKMADGTALDYLRRFVEAQGGDASVLDDPGQLPAAEVKIEVTAPAAGVVDALDAEAIGLCAMQLGAGRATKDASIDHGVGIVLHKKVGDRVQQGELLAELHAADRQQAEKVEKRLLQAISLGDQPVESPPLIRALVTESGIQKR
ncbi:MAG: pyrimidine-nucleoside phosphorylase [Firmicutes bacterium]|uniref:Pyrimidine-nucleoside phosphorylase n=1 Tax=Melghirimyces thermohalophilus TaxID=1236220 RepID=A0A1G6LLW4_9BACL|nr:pyrimidine-nucleoside phosphorylase [Melghirimyces thermohalophilus]MDA8353281.1 pyrimidine-nucleoside phosphorylase [Bacillota bacterium]SDC44233.1 pyrimidine-nucleoside phosphorylase [Melghirimyces thermohalophilus]